MIILNQTGDIDFLGEGILCAKKSYSVYICRPKEGTIINNILENSSIAVKDGQLVVSGLLGEQWPINPQKALRTYQTEDGKEIDLSLPYFDWIKVQTKHSATEYFAYFVSKKIYGHVGLYDYPTDNPAEAVYIDARGKGYRAISNVNDPASASNHDKGDYLVCCSNSGKPDLNNLWVVDGYIFSLTYTVIPGKDDAKQTILPPLPKPIIF